MSCIDIIAFAVDKAGMHAGSWNELRFLHIFSPKKLGVWCISRPLGKSFEMRPCVDDKPLLLTFDSLVKSQIACCQLLMITKAMK